MLLKSKFTQIYNNSALELIQKIGFVPNSAFVAGSGFSSALDSEQVIYRFDYSEFPFFPKTGIDGHKNELVILDINNRKILCFLGRFHLYEGHALETICSQILFSYYLGIKLILLTNAAGGLNPNYSVGDFVIIKDFINLSKFNLFELVQLKQNPQLYIRDIINMDKSHKLSYNLSKNGINSNYGTYIVVSGPNYETRSEIAMMRKLKGDVVGMSTYFEAQLASILGIETLAVSLVTNSAKEIKQSITHKEVTDVANNNNNNIKTLLQCFTQI